MRLSQSQSRLRSLDVFRGITIASMILVNNPGAHDDTYPSLLHATWTGWTFADTIFPFFLWIVGVAITLSSAARVARGENRSMLLKHAVYRSVLLFGCGVALLALTFPVRSFPFFRFEHYLQVSGALQKIAICYLAAIAIFLWGSPRTVAVWIAGLNLIYLGLMYFYPVPGCDGGDVWSIKCNFAGYIDRSLLDGHLQRDASSQDPDGLGSLLPQVSSVLFGVIAGYVLLQERNAARTTLRLLIMGCGLLFAGLGLAVWIPISKPLWTTSYAVLMAGLASISLGLWTWVVDVLQLGRWFRPLEIFGMNALAAFILSVAMRNVAKVHVFGLTFYDDVCRAIAKPPNASLLYAVAHVLGVYVIVWFMYRRRWFLRF